jgi:hypothetical protein
MAIGWFHSRGPDRNLLFGEEVTCPTCRAIFESTFYDFARSLRVKDVREAPCGLHLCPRCGEEWSSFARLWREFIF